MRLGAIGKQREQHSNSSGESGHARAMGAYDNTHMGALHTSNVDAIRDVHGLAVVERLKLRELGAVLLNKRREAKQHIAPVAAIGLAPSLERFSCSGDGIVDVLLICRIHTRDHLFCDRVDCVEPVRAVERDSRLGQ